MPPVGASLLAKNPRAPQSIRMPALSLTIFASKLAPTEEGVQSWWTLARLSSFLQRSDKCSTRRCLPALV
ncbi:hypothetical protein CDH05_17415 [Pseudomonas lactis]|nr:hypothetical protein CDH05_17415 [Pseudomonas lactis]